MSAHTPSESSTRQSLSQKAGPPVPSLPLSDWQGPTLKQFMLQIQHEFGGSLDLSTLRHSGIGKDEALDPSDIRELCDLLGLPPEDFGVS